MNNKFKISVIIPAYNVENYIAEALESVTNQTIGFEDNIQIIIINDGSTDNTADVCKKYKDKYPNNIIYIEKENGGISSARNEGFKYVEGKYINFLDSDDRWGVSAFKIAYEFFEKHYDEIDVVACRVKYFEARNDFHVLDFKFNAGTRIADINNPDEYYCVQTVVTSSFYKSEAIKDHRFDTRLKCAEDTAFATKVILEKCKIGFLREAWYFYRKRLAQNSTVDTIKSDKFYYGEMLDVFHKELIDYSKEKFGKIIPFIQAVLTNELLWHFDSCETHEVLNDEEFCTFKKKSKEVLSQIDDSIIFGYPEHKSYTRRSVAVNFKYGIDYFKALTLKDDKLYYREFEVFNMSSRSILCMLNSMSADNNRFRIEVLIAKWLLKSTASGGKLVLKVGDNFVNPDEILESTQKTVKTIDGGEYYYESFIFNINMELKEGDTVQIMPNLIYGEKTVPIYLNCTRFVQGKNPSTTCLVQGKYKVGYEDNSIQIEHKSLYH